MSLFVISLTTVLVTLEAKAKEGYDEASYKGRDACESAKHNDSEAAAKGSEKASGAWETEK